MSIRDQASRFLRSAWGSPQELAMEMYRAMVSKRSHDSIAAETSVAPLIFDGTMISAVTLVEAGTKADITQALEVFVTKPCIAIAITALNFVDVPEDPQPVAKARLDFWLEKRNDTREYGNTYFFSRSDEGFTKYLNFISQFSIPQGGSAWTLRGKSVDANVDFTVNPSATASQASLKLICYRDEDLSKIYLPGTGRRVSS